ncbi:MAG: GNAT family N-acetyltransferase [Spirochaetes bacterium]|nr:GNAT family N-acetyltransferase [Spirochaetota bacterium]
MKYRIEQNLFEFMSHFGYLEGCSLMYSKQLSWTKSPIIHLNRVFNTYLDNRNIETEIERIKDIFKHRFIHWFVTPSSSPRNLGDYLLKAGFQKAAEIHGKCFYISNMIHEKGLTEELKILQINNNKDLENWFNIVRSIFFPNVTNHAVYFEQFCELLAYYPQFVFYLAKYKDKIAGTGALFKGSDTAGLYWISVLPDFRGLGIANQIVNSLLIDAQNYGYSEAVLHSSYMARSLYQKIGFQLQTIDEIYTYQK